MDEEPKPTDVGIVSLHHDPIRTQATETWERVHRANYDRAFAMGNVVSQELWRSLDCPAFLDREHAKRVRDHGPPGRARGAKIPKRGMNLRNGRELQVLGEVSVDEEQFPAVRDAGRKMAVMNLGVRECQTHDATLPS